MWYFLCLTIGSLAGFMLASLLVAGKVSDMRGELDRLKGASDKLDYLKARIRAIQAQSVLSKTKGERTYMVQGPNGKFGKFTLPEV